MGTSLVGKNIGNYRICGRLGSGGVGQVWRAVDTTLGRTVAVKALRPELAGHSQVAERFRVEAQTLARLNHPNIATLHCLVEENGQLFMVLEHVEGQTFAQLLRVQGALELERAFELFHPALDGLAHAHEAGVIHRDVKPSNLMVDARGLVKVMDFGIARSGGSERVTHTGHLVGTPEYMSPEQIRAEDATAQSDIYALGILLYALLTGRPPFQREGEFDVMRAQVETPPPRPSDFAPGIPEAIEDVILRAMAKAPADRFASVSDLRDALVLAGAPEHTAGNLPVWAGETGRAGETGPPTLADPEAPTAAGHDAPTAVSAPEGRRVGRWQHAAVAVLALSLSLGANTLHVHPESPVPEPEATATAMESDPLPEASEIDGPGAAAAEEAAPAAAPRPPQAKRPPLAPRSQASEDPPAVEETGWVIRR